MKNGARPNEFVLREYFWLFADRKKTLELKHAGFRKVNFASAVTFFLSKFEKIGGKTDAEYRDELWEEERKEGFNNSH